jgi:DEAD/DEAH box helicase domain-containing protein
MFQGPYLDVRLPFRKAEEDWESRSPLDFGPSFAPYLHQLQAFARLSARDRVPQNTLVTTGTGSGKTECFLFPILDHCKRARSRGEKGIKAIILYPMNALASDQAERLAKLLHTSELGNIEAGLYVGGSGKHASRGPKHLVDDRHTLRNSPPDILLTNYRMLDFLLMRPEDADLWHDNAPSTLQYLVLDELHTYDGAQGSDVACLIRRLKARLSVPAQQLCCVGTSATIDSGSGSVQHDPSQLLADFATKIFAEPFSPECLIKEDRLTPDEALLGNNDNARDAFPFAVGQEAQLGPENFESVQAFIQAQQPLWFKQKPYGRTMLSEELRAHPFLRKLLRGIAGRERRSGARHWREVAQHIAKEDPDFADLTAQQQRLVLSSFISLVAFARSEASESAHFLQVQVQLWLR